ncbi:MAG: aspartyl/glutamyl-tRNA amidotransferase subunit B [Elusimicrobia bacterium RIFOXYB2_FULL_48_7]|nr:MAG: aspartyl/glutamyl-tRNA amidotransferase subunit B [Elusimicrobia bacterium RIFOXYB2_FULL_48_7]
MNNSAYEPVIGLEVHVQLKTKSKMFCGCSTEFTLDPNVNICPVCTGQPGVLPVANRKAIELNLKTALALNCGINRHSIFARKNYFYPDLPKNYQITQYEVPFGYDGFLEIDIERESPEAAAKAKKTIRIKRVHQEEDTGKLLHALGSRKLDYSLVDFNRSGVPLLEIVSEPDIANPDEAHAYLSALKSVLQYIEVSDCDMEKGSLRCDANVSIRKRGETELGTKTEIKNMNSFKSVRDALDYEIRRQVEVVGNGGKIVQETRLWDDKANITGSMRSKEQAHDYRYFPEPDLPPFEFDENLIDAIKKDIPELPEKLKQRLVEECQLSQYDAEVLTKEKPLARYFETALASMNPRTPNSPKLLANWINTELLGKLNSENKNVEQSPVSPENLGELVKLIETGAISGKIAKTVFADMMSTGRAPAAIIKEKGLVQISDENELKNVINDVIKENQKAADEYRAGKKQALGSLVGAVMKKTSGKANPQVVNKLLQEVLSEPAV